MFEYILRRLAYVIPISLGVTVLCISHDIGAAFRIADRISLLYQGRVIESGTPDQIRESSNPVVQQFIAGRAHGPITP